jgi:hypothetical protein
MRYLAPASDPGFGIGWTAAGFNDGSWASGTYGVGFDAGAMIRTELPSSPIVVYTRARFDVSNLTQIETVHFGADYDDGCVAWLNGVEVARLNMPAGQPGFATRASSNHESSNGATPSFESIFDVTAAARPVLVQGQNVLAVGVWNVNTTSSDLALVPRLSFNRPGTSGGTEICGTLSGAVTLTAAQSPYVVTCDVVVPLGSTLRIEPGVEIRMNGGVEVLVQGQVFAEGSAASPISVVANGGRWDRIAIDHGGGGGARNCVLRHVLLTGGTRLVDVTDTGSSTVVLEDLTFERWSTLALCWDDAPLLEVRRCRFGLNTPLAEADAEAVNGHNGGALVEYCTFGRRSGYNDVIDLADASWGGPVPVVRYNTFLGGDDDAIDFDNSDGWIIGNLILDHWPSPGASSQANGGGITGNDGSAPVVMNNIVYRCYHGIGYKNGCQPLLVNNLVLDCHVGFTLYQDDCGEPAPSAVLVNNIIWNNRHSETGANQNVVLNGAWFPDYCQTQSNQGSATMSYSIVEGGWPGVQNLNLDPRIADPEALDFSLLAGSPALDSAFGGPLAKAGVDPAALAAALGMDREGRARVDLPCVPNAGTGQPAFSDRGPLELPLPGPCGGIALFARGDSNGDRVLDVSDAVHMLLVLFAGLGGADCDDARDANDDGLADLSDAVAVLNHLFRGAGEPAAPYPEASVDPTADALGCNRGV